MKSKYLFIAGLIPLTNIIYRLLKCQSCDGNFFWLEVSGTTDLIINTIMAILIFNGAYHKRKEEQAMGEV